MFMVPMRQQSLTQEPSRSWWGGLGFLLPCLGSWHWGCRDGGARNGNRARTRPSSAG